MILAITAVYTVLGKFYRTSLIHLYICTFLVHLYFISLSALHLHIGYTWFIRHLYFIFTSFVLHLYFICTSFVRHLNFICTSFVRHLNFICTSFVLYLYFICTSFALHLYFIYLFICLLSFLPYTQNTKKIKKKIRQGSPRKPIRLMNRTTLYFICTSFELHLYFICTSFVRHLYFICTSFARHLYFICTSFVRHLYVICTSFVLPLIVICTFLILHLFFIVEWFICTSFVLHKYSRTLLYGHLLNTDISLLRTVFPVPGESKPLQFRAPVRVKFWQATWPWNSEISLDEMATKDIKKG